MAWIVRLVSLGAEGEEHSTDVLQIAKPRDLTDLASLGLTLAEGKRLLAGVQQELVAAQSLFDLTVPMFSQDDEFILRATTCGRHKIETSITKSASATRAISPTRSGR